MAATVYTASACNPNGLMKLSSDPRVVGIDCENQMVFRREVVAVDHARANALGIRVPGVDSDVEVLGMPSTVNSTVNTSPFLPPG